ncbi:PREDICTED: protein FAR1-RELATED SEQUENCE 6-like [Nicotiana attenuata]|uniref:protein FAR1-RELATED SEQUENCE 6-like n=1 Tax=Nicotiana attenuata TaxID=49451 RepID=UPI0009051C67|nr:PREDICTED: protein FAR1-RELATED SEQUENCE 6-like [Nicotiana attenuata]
MFVHQYELAIRAKHEKELEAKYRSKGFQIVCESMFKWEQQAIKCYTRTVYEFLKIRLRKLYHCEVSSPDDHQVVPGVEKFIISDNSVITKNDGDPVEYTVEYIPISDYFSCSCKCFESRGILCCHVLKILSHKKIDKIDEVYILTRWRSDVIRPHLNRFHQVGYPTMTPEYKTYRSMLKHFDMACDIALGTSVKFQYVKHNLKKMVHDLQNWDDEMIAPNQDQDDSDETEGTTLRDPQCDDPKGHHLLSN